MHLERPPLRQQCARFQWSLNAHESRSIRRVIVVHVHARLAALIHAR